MGAGMAKSETFGDRLFLLRENLEYTQAKAASMCGLRPSAWSRYETGREEPTVKTLVRIQTGLGLFGSEIGWLVTGDSTPRGLLSQLRADEAMRQIVKIATAVLEEKGGE